MSAPDQYLPPWYDIYRERMNRKYFEHVSQKYSTFIREVAKTRAKVFVEIGCGAGNITKAVREVVPNALYLMMDDCPQMLSLAIANNHNVFAYQRDVFDLDVDFWKHLREGGAVVHSHGLLEHYSDKDIRKLLNQHSRCEQLHYVPGHKYVTPSRGDERLLKIHEWRQIIAPTGLHYRITTFNDGHDYIIKVRPRHEKEDKEKSFSPY